MNRTNRWGLDWGQSINPLCYNMYHCLLNICHEVNTQQSTQACHADNSKMYTTLAASLCFIYFLVNKIFENRLNFYQNPGQGLQFPFVCSIFWWNFNIYILYYNREKASILWFQSQENVNILKTGSDMKDIQIIMMLITLIWLGIAFLLVRNIEKLSLLDFFFLRKTQFIRGIWPGTITVDFKENINVCVHFTCTFKFKCKSFQVLSEIKVTFYEIELNISNHDAFIWLVLYKVGLRLWRLNVRASSQWTEFQCLRGLHSKYQNMLPRSLFSKSTVTPQPKEGIQLLFLVLHFLLINLSLPPTSPTL